MIKIWTIISKEWAEVFKNRLVLFTVAFLPIILTALPLVTMYFTSRYSGEMSDAMSAESMAFFGDMCQGLTEMQCTEIYTLNLYTLMFMILPVAIPVTIAAYSIVGEKTSRSLEPLLATPITTTELLVGKMIAACVPAVVVTWLAFLVYAIAARFMVSDVVFAEAMKPMWWLAIFAVSPLLTLLAVSVAVMVSSRVTDPRVAEQLSALVILPLILLVVGQSVGLILINEQILLWLGLIIAVADVVLVYLTIKLFQRENILTRWK
ncbi:MAG: ABC transporter permease subunit [Chloroflexi bacterium]|nr:ABC transporter permease subunit [Chloroflexota bacterium]MBP7043625.1 ABC transporter permease subunit [Chloroflexota bacterium]